MSINFFKAECQEPDIDHELFGVCDDEDGSPAYVDAKDAQKWIATVENPKRESVTFTAIDNCIEIRRSDGNMESRCDGMLTYEDNIVFVELKNQRTHGWIPDGIEQLEITIRIFSDNHPIYIYKHKRAFVINKRKVRFHVLENELSRRFFDKYKVRINVGGIIKIK